MSDAAIGKRNGWNKYNIRQENDWETLYTISAEIARGAAAEMFCRQVKSIC